MRVQVSDIAREYYPDHTSQGWHPVPVRVAAQNLQRLSQLPVRGVIKLKGCFCSEKPREYVPFQPKNDSVLWLLFLQSQEAQKLTENTVIGSRAQNLQPSLADCFSGSVLTCAAGVQILQHQIQAFSRPGCALRHLVSLKRAQRARYQRRGCSAYRLLFSREEYQLQHAA